MAKLEELLTEIEQLIATAKPAAAEEKMRALIATIGEQELRPWEADLRRTLEQFFNKRRRALLNALEARLRPMSAPVSVVAPSRPRASIDLALAERDFGRDLRDLSELHIFQWSTFYRDCLVEYFERFLEGISNAETADASCLAVGRQLEKHAEEIFSKGFRHVRGQSGTSNDYAIVKSIAGLGRFLELPLDFYLARSQAAARGPQVLGIRGISSASIAAILRGYGSVRFGSESGWQVLARNSRTWLQYLAFVTAPTIEDLAARMPPGAIQEGVLGAVLPLADALDEMIRAPSGFIPIVALAQFLWEQRRLEVALRPPPDSDSPQMLEIHAYLDPTLVSRQSLQESASRQVSAVITSLRPDLSEIVSTSDVLSRSIIPISDEPDLRRLASHRVQEVLSLALYVRQSPRMAAAPLTYNFAREFPLQNPVLAKFFHVNRSSVRDLLRTFERRNGAHLWCSVRRSGKTTACFEMGTTTGSSTIVSQTCASTDQYPGASVFYDLINDALHERQRIPNNFFAEAVSLCAMSQEGLSDRFVFVLDEYETLFGRLRYSVVVDPGSRYSVVQPLLDQMVAFSRENLLVFMGQQPNAHFILMEQNQLSAYVEQDSFPLFRHVVGTTVGEFSELLRRILTAKVSFDAGFADSVYRETSGHPFLTAQVLAAFVDWLIERRRPVGELDLRTDDFARFSSERLSSASISLSPDYSFFRETIGESLGDYGRSQNPWLFSIYSVLREISRASPEDMTMTYRDYSTLVESLGVDSVGLSADYLLMTGSQSNFLERRGDDVRPRIQLLARIAGISRGRVSP